MMSANGPTFQEVLTYLATKSFTDDEQRQLVAAWNGNVRAQRAFRKQRAASKLSAGMRVTFKLKRGGTMSGTIEKVGRSNCWVIGSDGLRYYAPATGLTVA